jgi:hypothetical protein
MSKNRFKKLTFTITDFKYENRKMLWLSWNLTTVFSHFFKNLLPITIFSFLTVFKSYHIERKFFADCAII